MTLDPDDFYLEHGLMVLTERYHLKRGSCCGNGCRHCPYRHIAVSAGRISNTAEVRDGIKERETDALSDVGQHFTKEIR